MNRLTGFLAALLLSLCVLSGPWTMAAGAEPARSAKGARPGGPGVSGNPYAGAIVTDAVTGEVLIEDRPDVKGYPASITKLMVLLVYLEALDARRVSLQDPVTITAESARIGGSQVYLKEGEVFPVEDLLYALIVQSANDAATALAIQYAGSKEAFVEVMNQRAQALGMKDTVFHSVHGLPPGKGQLPDVSTPRDLALLSRELLKHPEALTYTSTRERPFRAASAEPFVMRSHNHLLKSMDGCDGLKTGYYRQAGFSIAATAQKQGVRAVAVVLGSEDRKVRDAKARELLSRGLMRLVAAAPAPPAAPAAPAATLPAAAPAAPAAAVQPEGAAARTQEAPAPPVEEEKSDTIQIRKSTFFLVLGIAVGVLVLLGVLFFVRTRGAKPTGAYLR